MDFNDDAYCFKCHGWHTTARCPADWKLAAQNNGTADPTFINLNGSSNSTTSWPPVVFGMSPFSSLRYSGDATKYKLKEISKENRDKWK